MQKNTPVSTIYIQVVMKLVSYEPFINEHEMCC